jgi:hypothetical protein
MLPPNLAKLEYARTLARIPDRILRKPQRYAPWPVLGGGIRREKGAKPACTAPMCVRAIPACRVRGCGVDARREPGHQHGCGEAVPGDAGGALVFISCVWMREESFIRNYP